MQNRKMNDRYVPMDEKVRDVIQEIRDYYWISQLNEAKLDSKQIETLKQDALKEWNKALPKNKGFFDRLFDKKWNANDTEFYERIQNQLSQTTDALSLKFFYEFIKSLKTNNPQLTKDTKNLMNLINKKIGEKIPFFVEQMEVYNAQIDQTVKNYVIKYYQDHENAILQKKAELLRMDNATTEQDKQFIEIANSEGDNKAWRLLDAYLKIDNTSRDQFFNDLITHLKLHFILCEESKFIPMNNMR